MWHEDVIVIGAGHYITADANIGERPRKRSRQPHRLKIRVYGESDPRGPEENRRAKLFSHP